MGVHLAKALEAGNIDLGVRIVAAQLGGVFVALLLREGKARRLAAHELEQRRHGGVDVTVFDEGAHIAEEEGQQKGADVGAVHIGIRHDDDLVVAELVDIEILAQSRAERDDDGLELVVAVNLIGADLFDVEHLAPKRQDRLEAGVAALRGGAARAVALDDVNFGQLGVILVAVAQLIRHRRAAEGALAADGFARLARGLARAVGHHRLIQNGAGDDGVLVEELHELIRDDGVHEGTHGGVAELGLGLTLKLRVGELDGDDGGKALAAVLAGDLVALFDQADLEAVGVEHARERGLEAGLVHTALGGVDVVGKGENVFLIAVVILQGDLGVGIAPGAAHVNDAGVQRVLGLIEEGDELADAALVAHLVALLLPLAQVDGADAQARVEEGLLAHTGVEDIVGVDRILEHFGVGLEGDGGAGVVGGADDGHLLRDVTAGEFHLVNLAVLMHLHGQPFGQRVDDARADAVQAAGDLIAPAAELAARVQDGKDDLERGTSGLRLNVHGDAAAVIDDGDGVVGIDLHGDVRAVAREGFVDGVIDDLIDEVVQTARGGRADVHARTLAHRFQSLKDLNFRGVVIVVGVDRRGLQKFVVCHGVLLSVQGTKNRAGTASDTFLRTLYSIFGWKGRLHRGPSFFLCKKVHAIHERFTQHAQKHNACERRKVERRARGAAPTVRREEGKRDLTA